MSTEKELREDLDRSTRALERNLKQIETLTAERALVELQAKRWQAVAQAFRDATSAEASAARDGECDPYLERAQGLYNKVATRYGTPEANRFWCGGCASNVMVDEDGCCTSCGGDTVPVFDPDALFDGASPRGGRA